MKTKTYVGEHTQKLQERLFTMGFKWANGTGSYIEEAFMLYISWDKKMLCYGDSLEVFLAAEEEELSLGELIKKIEKLEDNPCKEKRIDFKPFDKILVRGSEREPWTPAIFSNYQKGSYPYMCIAPEDAFSYAIPYKGNEHRAFTED